MMRPRPLLRVLLPFTLLLAFGACNKVAPLPDADSPAPRLQTIGPPPTEQEVREFTDKVAQAVRMHNAPQIDRLFRLGDLVERACSDLGVFGADLHAARAAYERMPHRNSLGSLITSTVSDGGAYTLLRVHSVDGRPRALFRLLSDGGDLNYHDCIVARFPDGTVGPEDIYVVLSGEFISQSLRRLVIPALDRIQEGRDPGPLSKTFAGLRPMGQTLTDGKPADVIAAYRQLPEHVQEDKALLLIYMQMLLEQGPAGEKEYLSAADRFRTRFPGDAAGDLVSIDYHVSKKQFDRALAAVDRIDKIIGDPYLGAMRGEILMKATRFDEARTAIEKAIEQEPDLERLYWLRLRLSLWEGEFDDTLAWLKKRAQAIKSPVQNLSRNREYAGFVRSPQYREWLAWYKARALASPKK